MIEVFLGKYHDYKIILVDADDATLVATDDEKSSDSLLILNKDGADEVAWFKDWVYAVKTDNLMEWVNE